MRKLFGTDGVRGVAGEVLTAELALALGAAATREVGGEHPRVLVIRDTRESGPMLEAALAAGIASAGGDVLLGGVLPTPAAPLLIGRFGFDLAAVISASHNPFEDNGIKFFGADALQALRRDRAGDRAAAGGAAAERAARPDRRDQPAARDRPRTTCARCRSASPGCRSRASTSCWTAPTARRIAPAPRSSAGSAPRSPCSPRPPTGATSTTAAARRTWTASSPRCATAATTSASPSTATAIACWRSTATARSSTATSSSRSRRCTCARRTACPAAASS